MAQDNFTIKTLSGIITEQQYFLDKIHALVFGNKDLSDDENLEEIAKVFADPGYYGLEQKIETTFKLINHE